MADRAAQVTTAPNTAALPTLLVAAALLYLGWINRDEGHLVAERGLGYVLGIAGGGVLILTPLYSLRKRARWLHRAGKVRHWFRAHMVAGGLGPVLILFHCNFAPGSTNSSVALAAMLVVAASGMVGRWLYVRIHRGLYGHRLELRELALDSREAGARLDPLLAASARLRRRMCAFEVCVSARPSGLLESSRQWAGIVVQTRWTLLVAALWLVRMRASRVTRATRLAGAKPPPMRRTLAAVRDHLAAVRRVARFRVYERLFALWHVFHVPLFFMLVISVTVHVVAVHLY